MPHSTDERARELREVLSIAADHLTQYRQFSEDMRKNGRGFTPSNEFSPDYLAGMIRAVLERAYSRAAE